jgi:long-chain acyl-CoA synthetase
VIVTAIPLYHIFALMVNFLTYFSVGADSWLVANPRDMDGFVETLKQSKPRSSWASTRCTPGLVMHPKIREVDFSRLHLAGGGGAAVVGATSDKWKAITGQFIREGYGLSETSPVLSFNPASIKEFSGTTGLPCPAPTSSCSTTRAIEVALGQSGEVCAKGPQVMRGYWNQPEANAAAFTPTATSRPVTSACSTTRAS